MTMSHSPHPLSARISNPLSLLAVLLGPRPSVTIPLKQTTWAQTSGLWASLTEALLEAPPCLFRAVFPGRGYLSRPYHPSGVPTHPLLLRVHPVNAAAAAAAGLLVPEAAALGDQQAVATTPQAGAAHDAHPGAHAGI